jgi:hypothetical protein
MGLIDPNGAPSRGLAVLVVTAIMLVLSTIFVVLRMISRSLIVRRVTLDDYFMVLAWVCSHLLSKLSIC